MKILKGGVSGLVPVHLSVDRDSVEAEINKRTRMLLFFKRLIHASEQCIHHIIFLIRLNRWKWNLNKITEFIPDIVGKCGSAYA